MPAVAFGSGRLRLGSFSARVLLESCSSARANRICSNRLGSLGSSLGGCYIFRQTVFFVSCGGLAVALIRSSTLSNISGSIGGTTYARNRGGLYARNRTVPINPNSNAQTRARSSFGSFSGGWSSALTANQRAAWAAFAESSPVQNRLGESITLTGQQAYVRSNTLLQLADESIVSVPPSLTPPEFAVLNGAEASYDVSTPTVTLTLAALTTGLVLAFSGPAQSAGASSLKVPFRFFGVADLDGDATAVITAGTGARVYSVGDRMAWRFVIISTAGAVGNTILVRGVAVA